MTSDARNPILVAIDTPEIGRAKSLSQSSAGAVGGIKLGLEFFNANGPAREAADAESTRLGIARPRVIAVTVLTSMDDDDLDAVGQRGPAAAARDIPRELA